MWPINAAADAAFTFAFAVVDVVLFLGSYLASTGIGRAVDRASMRRLPSPRLSLPPADYRASANPHVEPAALRLGHFPAQRDLWAVAYLRDGDNAVADLLIARAVCLGWIVAEEGRLIVKHHSVPHDAVLHEFSVSLQFHVNKPISLSTLWTESQAAAQRVASTLADVVASSGMDRTPRSQRVSLLTFFAAPGLMTAIALAGIVVAITSGSPWAHLGVMLLAHCVVSFGIAHFVWRARSAQASTYLTWSNSTAAALKDEVASGGTHQIKQVSVVVAIAGLREVAFTPVFRDMHLLGPPPDKGAA